MSNEISNNQLFGKITELFELARKKVATTVNLTMVHTYYEIGRMIVEDEQQGKERAEYGKSVLKDLSKRLTEKFGKGFSVENLDKMRYFYKVYSNSISSTLLTKLENVEKQINTICLKPSNELQRDENKLKANSATPLRKSENSDINFDSIQQISSANFNRFILGWSHYLILMRIENPAERSFY